MMATAPRSSFNHFKRPTLHIRCVLRFPSKMLPHVDREGSQGHPTASTGSVGLNRVEMQQIEPIPRPPVKWPPNQVDDVVSTAPMRLPGDLPCLFCRLPALFSDFTRSRPPHRRPQPIDPRPPRSCWSLVMPLGWRCTVDMVIHPSDWLGTMPRFRSQPRPLGQSRPPHQ